MYVIFYMRSSDLKECFLRSDRANHKNRPTPLICHINKSKAFSDAGMGTVRAHPTSVVKICPLGRLIIANVTIIIMSSLIMPCHAIIIFCHQLSRSKHTLSVSLIPQAAPHQATPTFSATQHILIFRMQTFRLALLTFDDKKIKRWRVAFNKLFSAQNS